MDVQKAMRGAFEKWGCPQTVRVDNGIPWTVPGGLPSGLSLWLAGLGVAVHWNDPYRPEQNGVVERSQGTTRRWAEPRTCADLAELRARVQNEDRIQREEYPSIEGKSRREAYPWLLHSGRGYCQTWERQVWDLSEALRFLGRYRVRRKVSERGQVSVYHRLVQVGQQHGGRWTYVGLDPEMVQWVISDPEGNELRRRPAPEFTQEAIVGLSLVRP